MSAPEHYIGRIVILGGEVLKTAYFDDKAVLEVLHLPLNASNRPVSALRESQGLFVAVADPTVAAPRVAPGAVVTIVGEVVRPERSGGAAATGTAPRVLVRHVHVWRSTQEDDETVISGVPTALLTSFHSGGIPGSYTASTSEP